MTEERAITVRSLQDSGVAITGGTSGVGLASARQLAQAGVRRFVLMGRDEQRGRAACAAVRDVAADAQVEFVAVDANDPADATRAIERALALIGAIDVLVNSSSSAAVPELLHDTPIEQIGPLLTGQALAPMHMTRAVPGEAVLGAGMAAIVMFSRAAAMEAKRDGVRINALTPSLITGTPTGDRVLEGGFSAKLFAKAMSMAHLGVTEADDLAALVVFLASPAAARLTGQAISVNGGISAA
jgi:2-hydroxycyclohexanecarboxyl-CoA dehydrogenase